MGSRAFAQVIRWWWCLVFLVAGAGAVELPAPPSVDAVTSTSAIVRWYTDVETGTRVHYGLEPNRLTHFAEGGIGTLHEVTLTGLQPGTPYYFSVATSRKLLATGTFTTSASPVSNTAPASTSPMAMVRGFINRWRSDAPKETPTTPAAAERTPPAAATWGNPASLQDHFARHGADFRARSAEDYAAQAWQFRQRARAGGLLVKVDDAGVQRVFDPRSGAFAAYNPDGTTKTYFKPGNPNYFDKQPGRIIRAATP
jgi:hypothetical protein